MLVLGAALLIVAVASCNHSEESSSSENHSKELVQSLRRQLMRENDDYLNEDINNTEDIHLRAHGQNDRKENKKSSNIIFHNNIQNTEYNEKEQVQRVETKLSGRNFYVREIRNSENKDHESNISYDTAENRKNTKVEHPISKKDLLYYMDEEKFVRKQQNSIERSKKIKNNTSSVKYKMLKLKRQYRRGAQNRYLQEEGKDGVAIVSLDKGPFPELRLPLSRRQYKHEHGGAITDDEEIPPPPVYTSDTETAVVETEQLVPENTTTKMTSPY